MSTATPIRDLPLVPLREWGLHDPEASAEVHYHSAEGRESVELRTRRQPDFKWNIQLVADSPEPPPPAGRVVVLAFEARCREPIQRTDIAYLGITCSALGLSGQAELDGAWRRLRFSARVPAGRSDAIKLCFLFGFDPQTVELRDVGLQLVAETDPESVPGLSRPYRGFEPDAPWRSAAETEIARHRCASRQVLVRDRRGRPLADVAVTFEQIDHAFAYGSAYGSKVFAGEAGDEADRARYHEIFAGLGNTTVIDNGLKWPNWDRQRALALAQVDELVARGLRVRGHCLVWPSAEHMPPAIAEDFADDAAISRHIRAHIADEAGALRGRLVDWDVLNEPYIYHQLIDRLGMDEVAEWFRIAHQADPGARLFINDYDILVDGGHFETHLDHYERFIDELLQRGAPLHGIGFQGHFRGGFTDIERFRELLDRFARFGLPLAITEYDAAVPHGHETLHAQLLDDVVTASFAHPLVDTFLHWGFWAGCHWRPETALYREDWSARASARRWHQLWHERWCSRGEAVTDAAGSCQIAGYRGRYRLRLQDRVLDCELDGEPLVIEL